MAASGYQRSASPLKILGSGLTLCSGPKQVARGSVRRAIQPSLGAANRPSPRNLPGAQTERPSNYYNKHPFRENKGQIKFILRREPAEIGKREFIVKKLYFLWSYILDSFTDN